LTYFVFIAGSFIIIMPMNERLIDNLMRVKGPVVSLLKLTVLILTIYFSIYGLVAQLCEIIRATNINNVTRADLQLPVRYLNDIYNLPMLSPRMIMPANHGYVAIYKRVDVLSGPRPDSSELARVVMSAARHHMTIYDEPYFVFWGGKVT
jgi:hypothetical protein